MEARRNRPIGSSFCGRIDIETRLFEIKQNFLKDILTGKTKYTHSIYNAAPNAKIDPFGKFLTID